MQAETSWTRTSDCGPMNKRVRLMRATPTRSPSGAMTAAQFVEYDRVWAAIRDLTATQSIAARQSLSEVSAIVKIRNRRGVFPNDRVLWASTPVPAPSTLSATINNVTPMVTLASTSGYPTLFPYLIKIGDEVMQVTAATGNTLEVARGWGGTDKAAHGLGSDVFPVTLRIFGVIGMRDETGSREFLLLDCKEASNGS